MGDKRRHGCGKAHTHHPKGDGWRQGETNLEKADTPSNKGTHVGRQWETRPDALSNTGTHVGRQGDKTSGRRAHHPTQACMWGRPLGRRTHHPSKGNKKGYIGRQGETGGDKTIRKTDTPSNTKADTLRKHSEPLTVLIGKKHKEYISEAGPHSIAFKPTLR